MHWILQDNLYNEKQYEELLSLLERYGVPHTVVKVIPFIHELVEDVNPDGLVYVCGATTLNHIAKKKGWFPGSFINDAFHYDVWSFWYDVLNEDRESYVVPIRNAKEFVKGTVFMRPANDGKAFAGTVMHEDDFAEWYDRLMGTKAYEEVDTFLDTEIVISPPKNILQEYRLFVVDGEIVTASLYKQGKQVFYRTGAPEGVMEFAQEQIDRWQPARAFVIDIAVTDDGPKVIEINNINSAGFYAADLSKLIQAIEGMKF